MAGMKILMPTRILPFHDIGGMQEAAWDTARALARAGCEVVVLTTSCKVLPASSVIDGVRVECLKVPAMRYSRAWWRESRRQYLERYSEWADIVLSISAAGLCLASSCPVGTRRPTFFAQAHGTLWGEIVSKLKERRPVALLKALYLARNLMLDRRYRHCDGLIAVGEKVATDLQAQPTRRLLGGRPVHLIRNGIDTDLFQFNAGARSRIRAEYGFTNEDFVVISTSRLHPQKGLRESFEAMALATQQARRIRHLVIGSGPQESELRELAGALGTPTTFTGAVPRRLLPDYLSAADAFLFTTLRQEGLPLNMLEALACGLPCVVSKHVTLRDLDLVSVDPRSKESVAGAVVGLARGERRDRCCRLPEIYSLAHSGGAYLELFSRYHRREASA